MALAAGALAVGIGAPAAASAQTLYTGTPVPRVGAADVSASVAVPAVRTVRTQSSRGLALTGVDVAQIGAVGLGAIMAGAVLVRRGRRSA